MNKYLVYLVMGFLFLLFPIQHTLAQFVNFRIEIVPGVNFISNVNGDPNGTWEKNQSRVWIGLEVQDNSPLLVEISYPNREFTIQPDMHFLNDGSSDYENAVCLTKKISRVLPISPSKLIRNQYPRPQAYLAWLGLPKMEGVYLKIEYQ